MRQGPAERKRFLAVLREANSRADCFCGREKNHPGCLLCLEVEHDTREARRG